MIIELFLAFLIFFTPLAYGAVQPWSVAVVEVCAVSMAGVWIVSMIHKGEIKLIKLPLSFIMPCILFIGYVLFQPTVYAYQTRYELMKIISYGLIFLVLVNSIVTKKQIQRIIIYVIAVSFMLSIFFFLRYFGASAPRGIINPDHFAGYLSMVILLSIGFFLPEKCIPQALLKHK